MAFGMGMGMMQAQSMELSQRLEMKTEQRLTLEQRLEARLAQQVHQNVTLAQYLYHEDLIDGFIRWADEHNSWAEFDREGFKFRYAALPYRVAKPIADKAGFGFAHCHYNPFEGRARGDWTLFVVKDMIPDEFVDLVALHERGEEISLGDHYFASKLEFAASKLWKQARKYVSFINGVYPSKFTDLTQKVLFPVLPKELLEELTAEGRRNEEELERAEELIERHPIPSSAIRLMLKYEETTKSVCEKIRQSAAYAQSPITRWIISMAHVPPEAVANAVNGVLTNTLLSISPEEARAASKPEADEMMRFFSQIVGRDAYRLTNRHLEIPSRFMEAYEAARKGENVAAVKYTAEDKRRGKMGIQGDIRGYYQAAVNL